MNPDQVLLYRSWLHIGESEYLCSFDESLETGDKESESVLPGYPGRYGGLSRDGYDSRSLPQPIFNSIEFRKILEGGVESIFTTEENVLVKTSERWGILDGNLQNELAGGFIRQGGKCSSLDSNHVVWMDDSLSVLNTRGEIEKQIYLLLGGKRGFGDVLLNGSNVLLSGLMSPPYIPDMDEPFITHECIDVEKLGDPDEDSGLCDPEQVETLSYYGNNIVPPVWLNTGIFFGVNQALVMTDSKLKPVRKYVFDKELLFISGNNKTGELFCLSRAGSRFDLDCIDIKTNKVLYTLEDIGISPVCPALSCSSGYRIVVGEASFKAWSSDLTEVVHFDTFISGFPVYASVIGDVLFIATGLHIFVWDCLMWDRKIYQSPEVITTPVVQAGSGILLMGTEKGVYAIENKQDY